MIGKGREKWIREKFPWQVGSIRQSGVVLAIGVCEAKTGGVWCEMRLERQAVEKLHRPLQLILQIFILSRSNEKPLTCFKLGKGNDMIGCFFWIDPSACNRDHCSVWGNVDW